jgi:pimeloyl-ACP methyl ester carboxylesterase
MNGRARSPCVALALLLLALPLKPSTAAPDPALDGGRPALLVALSDGRRLNFRCEGRGAPTVLFEAGYAGTSLAWTRVLPRIAAHTRACAYDRAGYGFSDEGPAPRDGAAVAKDLDEGLKAARIKGPFILVGHSAGALYLRLFAARRRGAIAGMVLIDPSIEHQDRRFEAVFGPGAGGMAGQKAGATACLAAAERRALPSADPALAACTPKPSPNASVADNAARMAEALRPATWRTRLSEADTLWGATSDEAETAPAALGDLPLIVLTADGTYAAAPRSIRPAAESLWRTLHQEIARRSRRGREQPVAHTSHMIMLDQPAAVAEAIEAVIAQAKTAGARKGP